MPDINFNPFPVIHTERLLLRQLVPADAPRILQLRSDKKALEFLDKAPLQNEDEALALINTIQDNLNNNNGITWAVALKEEPELLIGTLGLWRIMKEHYRAEIGYMLLPGYFNKGYMTEAIYTVNDFAFNQLNLHSIEANINPANKASEALLLKTGFKQEAYFKENFYFNGAFKDSAVFSLLKNNK
jgi:[ribosomal protein S5]-alanine N-acetyltransferase